MDPKPIYEFGYSREELSKLNQGRAIELLRKLYGYSTASDSSNNHNSINIMIRPNRI